MTRTYSTITWGLTLMLAAVVLAWKQSLPWTLAAAGAVATIAGLAKVAVEGTALAKQEAKHTTSPRP